MKSNTACFLFFLQFSLIAHGQPVSLEYFVHAATSNSPYLKDYANQVLSSQLDSARIVAGYRPQVNVTSYNIYAPVIRGFGYDQAISNGGYFSTLMGLNKTLVGKKNLSNQFDSVQLQSRTAQNNAKISEKELVKSVISQYIVTYGDMQELTFNKEVLDLLNKEETILRNLTEKNVYHQADYLTFLVNLHQQTFLFKQTQVRYKNDFAQLNYVSGILDTNTVQLMEPAIQLSQIPDIHNSIFFKQYEIDSLKLRNSRIALNYNYRPRVNLIADGGYSSTLTYLPYKNFGTSFGFNVTVPIYDGHLRKIQYNKIQLAEQTRSNYKIFFTNQYYQQIAQLTQQLDGTEQLIGQIQEQIKYSESLIKVNIKLLETGDVRMADYIIAIGNYLNAKNLLTQNRIARLQIINQINYWNR